MPSISKAEISELRNTSTFANSTIRCDSSRTEFTQSKMRDKRTARSTSPPSRPARLCPVLRNKSLNTHKTNNEIRIYNDLP